MTANRLFGKLAERGYLWSNEVAATLSLSVLLGHDALEKAFLEHLAESGAPGIEPGLSWDSEHQTRRHGRLDVLGSRGDEPVVLIEAKFGSPVSEPQLRTYLEWLQSHYAAVESCLVMLVPSQQRDLAQRVKSKLDPVSGSTRVTVVTWDGVLDCLHTAAEGDPGLLSDIEQLASLADVATGWDIGPFTLDDLASEEESLLVEFGRLSYLVTEQLLSGGRLWPAVTRGPFRDGRYYVNGEGEPNLFVGVPRVRPNHQPSAPLWVRVHSATPRFAATKHHLEAAGLVVPTGDGHVWTPLHVPVDVPGPVAVAALVEQVTQIDSIARTGSADPTSTSAPV